MKSRAYGLVELLFLAVFLTVLKAPVASGELRIDSVYPTLGALGAPLSITIQGSDFNADTRVSMALDSGNRRSVVGGIDTPFYAWDLVISGNIAYVADDAGGVQVIDISDPENPRILRTVDTPGTAYSLALSGTNLYVADGESGLQIMDISDPANPHSIGSINTPGETGEKGATDIKISDGKAYVVSIAASGSGLQVIDVSSPANPQLAGTMDLDLNSSGDSQDLRDKDGYLDIQGNYAYVTRKPSRNKNGSLLIIDIADPSGLKMVGSVAMPTYYVTDVTVADGIAYVATQHSGIQVVNVSNPANPMIINSVNTTGRPFGITVVEQTGYIADDLGGMTILDLTDPMDIQISGIIDTPSQARSIVLKDDFAYVADGEGGFQVLDIKAPQVQQVISWVPTPGVSQFFEVKGNYVFLGDGVGGLQVIDISDPELPAIVGNVSTVDKARHVDVVGDIAYIADTIGGLQIADVSVPEHPSIIGTYIPPNPLPLWDPQPWTRYVTVSEPDDIAFLADANRTILVDVSDPENPSEITIVEGFGVVDGIIAIKGRYAYVPDKNKGNIKVIDFSTPASAAIIKTIDVPGDDNEGPRCVTIVGNKAYVANGDHGLCILDISNPANPVFSPAWSITLFDRAYFVTVVGNVAYVADGDSGIQLVDVSDPANMAVIGSLDTAGGANCVYVSGDKAFVGDFGNGFIVVPLPVEIKPVVMESASILRCTLPSPSLPGHYILRVFNNSGDLFDLDGGVTFAETVKNSKAIIIAGGNYCAGQEHIEEGVQTVANAAYKALLYQGFDKDEDVLFLGPDTTIDVDGLNPYDDKDDVDLENIYSNIEYAMTTWAANEAPHDLIVYLVGHGAPGYFKPNCSDRVMANQIKTWVNNLQSVASGNVIFVYDACQAGSFLLNMDVPVTPNRIVITSCKSNEESKFLFGGIVSYSFGFWNSVSNRKGARLDKAFNSGRDLVKSYQTPWVDANGDRQPNTPEDIISDVIIFGRGYLPDKQLPNIGAVSETQSLSGSTSADIWAGGIITPGGSLEEVFATVTPPCFNPDPSTPVTDMDKVVLSDDDQDGVFEGSYGNFSAPGAYKIAVYAKDSNGNVSEPRETYVYQSIGPDAYENDNSYEKASNITISDTTSQCHNFFDSSDEDWVTFFGVSGQTYTIEVSDLGLNCDAVIEVYDTDGSTLLVDKDAVGNPRADELLHWECPADGFYYVKIRPAQAGIFGEGTEYRFEIYRSVAALLGRIGGTIVDADTDAPIVGASLQTNQGESAGSVQNGVYLIIHRAGTDFSLTADAPGYLKKTVTDIDVNEDETTTVNLKLKAGEDGSGNGDDGGSSSGGGGGSGGCFIQTIY